MAYKALYRKYRPKTFESVAGQDTIVRILKNSIISDRISHAYLFYGPRGTGKTSIAKIFAKTVNCDNSKLGIACGKCDKCLENDSNGTVDIIEIDAASNNGVDEIRELKSKVNLVPSLMKYKVYIIDEVHMLSIGAFNALLKTLEEPPNHVIFILATTELHKVPNTIISRCQLMEFRRISDEEMFNAIKNVVKLEKINISDSAIAEIIKYSDGGMRDALSLLDKLSLYTDELIDDEQVRSICSNATKCDVDEILSYIKDKNLKLLVDKIDNLYSKGIDLINVANDMILSLKNDMLKENNTYICSIIIRISDAVEKMKVSSNPRIIFEAYLLEMISNDTRKNISREIFSNKNECKVVTNQETKSQDTENNDDKNCVDQTKFIDIRVNNTFVNADKTILKSIQTSWNNLSKYAFDPIYGSIACSLMDSKPVLASSEYIVLMFEYDSFVEKVNNNFLKIQMFINDFIGHNYKIVGLTKEEWNARKEEYILKKKNKEKYFYMDDEFNDTSSDTYKIDSNINGENNLTSMTEELFGKENIIIK